MAERLFSERGFGNVTVAEIADAANISVKTLFTYVRSKEELVFSDDPNILDALVAAVRSRAPGQPPLDVVADALLAALDDDTDRTGLEGFHHMIGQSSRRQVQGPRPMGRDRGRAHHGPGRAGRRVRERADHRLTAAQSKALRTVTSQEVRASVAQAAVASRCWCRCRTPTAHGAAAWRWRRRWR